MILPKEISWRIKNKNQVAEHVLKQAKYKTSPDLTCQITHKNTTVTDCGLMGRAYAGISKVLVKLNNKTYQSSSGVEIDSDATTPNFIDAYSELLKNGGGLLDMSVNSIKESTFMLAGDGATHPTLIENCGTYYYEMSFSNGADTETSSSGVQINHNNLEVHVEKEASTNALTVDFFVEYENNYIMNKNERVWRIEDTLQYQS